MAGRRTRAPAALRPTTRRTSYRVLGRSYDTWRIGFIKAVLRLYEVEVPASATKPHLMERIATIVQDHKLRDADYRVMNEAYWSGEELRRPGSDSAASDVQTSTMCVVCWDPLNTDTTPKTAITETCDHEPNVCLNCLSASIQSQILAKFWNEIGCPACGEHMEFSHVQEFASPEVFIRYDQLALQASVPGGQLQHCRAPECSSVQLCFPEQDSFMICGQCAARTCLTCDTPWHPDISCKTHAQGLTPEEVANEQYISSKAQRCPKCEVPGIKSSGCDHMTCPQCTYAYCWKCLANYEEIIEHGNDNHRKHCPYHPDNLEDNASGHGYEVASGSESESDGCDSEADEEDREDEDAEDEVVEGEE